MIRFSLIYLRQWFLIFLAFGGVISLGLAASPTPGLTVRDSGVILYSGQDTNSLQLTTLQKDEPLRLLAEAVGNETWYMVRTGQGLIGWLRASDAMSGGGHGQETAKSRNHFRFAGITYQGACSVEHRENIASNARV